MLDTRGETATKVRFSAKIRSVLRRWPRNSDVDWSQFAPDWYCAHNYASLRDDDEQIMARIRDFFASAGLSGAAGVDVGAGANLYPALAMLPFCRSLELREFSSANVRWLRKHTADYDGSWDQFWEVYRRHEAYAAVAHPRARLAELVEIYQTSVFDLPRRRWDVGTMCFVACSLSSDMSEFHRAVERFLRSLRPGAPFAATFMEHSMGYRVDGSWFPAVSIDRSNVEHSLARYAYAVEIDRVTTQQPLRDGYDGAMILAMGRAKG